METLTFLTRPSNVVRILTLTALLLSSMARETNAETHKLRANGRTLVEAEAYSEKSSPDSPKVGLGENCSGKRYLGYFWKGQWFEFHVDVSQLRNYSIAFRASSVDGTNIRVQLIDENGDELELATVEIPKTEHYTKFVNVKGTLISLPQGVHTLRFKNMNNGGVDIDHVTFTAGSKNDVVTARPDGNAGPDINPLKGFQSGWWREDDDYASVGFQYVEWGKFEPTDDVFDWDYVEDVLDRPGTQGRHCILQFAVDWDDWDQKAPVGDSHYKGPDWLLKLVGENRGRAFPDDPNSRISRATNYNHPEFIEQATEAIKALCDHYKDDPRTFVLQAGLVGYWGEWHTFPRTDWSPSDSTKLSVLGAYLENLGPKGLTQIHYPDESVVKPKKRVGYTNGSATLSDHGREFGEAINAGRLWENGPVTGEWPPTVENQHWNAFFLTEKGNQFIEQGHYSALLFPEQKQILERLPNWKRDGLFMDMHRRMGYNFQVKSVRHLVAADNSGQTYIEIDLHNSGIAPFYKDWDVQLAILNSKDAEVIDLLEADIDLRTLMPDESLTIKGSSKKELVSGESYQIGLRLLQPKADKLKAASWRLNARNTYIVLANDVDVIDGVWDEDNALQGGWNILDNIERRKPEQQQAIKGQFFPLHGSFRPSEDKN